MAITVELRPALARYAQSCMESGRFASVSDVVEAALHAQQAAEERRAAFVVSLEQAVAEGERVGFLSAEAVRRDMTAAIEEARGPRRPA